jgi:hypothetical protein
MVRGRGLVTGGAYQSLDDDPVGQDHRVTVDARAIPARLPPRHGIAVAGRLETRLGWFGSGDRRKVAVVLTADGRRVHVPIEPADVSLLDLLLALPGLGGLIRLITGSRRDRGTRGDERL